MLGIARMEGKRDTSQMELAVSWNGRERSFAIAEFSVDEIVIVDFRGSDIDLCQHEASIDYCDGELLDEVHCRVVFRGFEGPGVARLRIIADGSERIEVARLAAMLRARLEEERALEHARIAVACGWV